MTLPKVRAVSSAGSERLPYKQDVGGSNTSLPTFKDAIYSVFFVLYRLAQLVPERPATAGQDVGGTPKGTPLEESLPKGTTSWHCPQAQMLQSELFLYIT